MCYPPTHPFLLQKRFGRSKYLHRTAAQTIFQIHWYRDFSAVETFGELKPA